MDAELALRSGDISSVPTLNIIYLKLCAAPIPSYIKNNLELFAIVLMIQRLDKRKVAEDRSMYDYDSTAAPLFEEWLP